jgi:phage gpG-like protein
MMRLILKGLQETRDRMTGRYRKLSDMRTPHLKGAIAIHSWTIRNMNAEGRMHGGEFTWPALKPSTIARRQRKGYWPGRMLQVKGILKGGFVPNATQEKGWVENATPYAVYHEFGTRRNRPPRRKMFPSERKALEIVRPIFGQHVKVSIQ